MPKILILIHVNRFLMYKIKSLLTKNPVLTKEIRILICFISFTIARKVCVFNKIQNLIYINFSVFCKKKLIQELSYIYSLLILFSYKLYYTLLN